MSRDSNSLYLVNKQEM